MPVCQCPSCLLHGLQTPSTGEQVASWQELVPCALVRGVYVVAGRGGQCLSLTAQSLVCGSGVELGSARDLGPRGSAGLYTVANSSS